MSWALDQARLDWVTRHLKLSYYLYDMAAAGDATAAGLRASISARAHLTENQIRFARMHVRDQRPGADLDESNSVVNTQRMEG